MMRPVLVEEIQIEYSGYCDVIIYHYFPSKLE